MTNAEFPAQTHIARHCVRVCIIDMLHEAIQPNLSLSNQPQSKDEVWSPRCGMPRKIAHMDMP